MNPANSPFDAKQPLQRRVLLIEDHPDSRETLRLVLQIDGHTVEVAGDGLQGVEKALECAPEVAIVDIGLPRLNGYEVARRLRDAFGDAIVLIALTGYCQESDRQRAFEAGFDFHMAKPADVRELSYLLRAGPTARAFRPLWEEASQPAYNRGKSARVTVEGAVSWTRVGIPEFAE